MGIMFAFTIPPHLQGLLRQLGLFCEARESQTMVVLGYDTWYALIVGCISMKHRDVFHITSFVGLCHNGYSVAVVSLNVSH